MQDITCFYIQRIHTFGLKSVQVWAFYDSVCTAGEFGVAVYRTLPFISVDALIVIDIVIIIVTVLSVDDPEGY